MFDGCLRFYLTTSGLSFLYFRVTYVLYLNRTVFFGTYLGVQYILNKVEKEGKDGGKLENHALQWWRNMHRQK